MSQFITTSPLLNMRPVGTAAERSLPRLEAILQREFKGRISLRLAEPVARRDGAGIDWYVDDDDPLTQLVGLPDDLSAYYRNRLKAEIATISAAAADYEARNDPAAKATASALRNSICYPGDDNVWVQGDAPSGKATIVLTAWGYEPQSSQLTGSHIIHKRERIFPDSAQVLIDQNHAAEEPGPTNAAASPQRRNWTGVLTNVLWGLAVVLPFFIGWMLLPACGLRVPFTDRYIYGWGDGAFCRQLPNPQMEAGRLQVAELTAELGTLSSEVRAKIFQCAIASRTATPAPQDEQLIQAEGLDVDPNETSVSLTWNNTNDLDLYLVCPDGQSVPLEGARCGFRHQIDKNAGPGGPPLVSDPVEYIRWENGELQPGTYRVEVIYFKNNPPSPVETDFTVALRRNGTKREFPGKTSARVPGSNKERISITEFTVP